MLLLLLIASVAFPAHPAPWEKGNRLNRVITSYDRNKVETVSGTVEKIYEKVPSTVANPDSLGLHMILRTGTETVDIHLGPRWYIKTLDGRIEEGDTVQVVGSGEEGHASADGKPGMREIRAAEVVKGGIVVLKLRDGDGKPLWSGY